MKVKTEPKWLSSPKMPEEKGAVKESQVRFPGIVLDRPNMQQGYPAGTYTGGYLATKGSLYVSKSWTKGQQDLARWYDQRVLNRLRISPDSFPTDVPNYILAALEDLRSAYSLRQTAIRFGGTPAWWLKERPLEVRSFLLQDCGFSKVAVRFRRSDTVTEDSPVYSSADVEKEMRRRLGLETMGILMAIRFMASPMEKAMLETVIKDSFQERMTTIVMAVARLMETSDLSFAATHSIGRKLKVMLDDLVIPDAMMVRIPAPKVEKGKDDPTSGDRKKELEMHRPKHDKDIEMEVANTKSDVDWSKISARKKVDPKVGAMLKRIVSVVHKYYHQYYSTGSRSSEFREFPSTRNLGFGQYSSYDTYYRGQPFGSTKETTKAGRDEDGMALAPWGTLTIHTPRLTHTTVKPRDIGRLHRHMARESGRVPRYMHRYMSDGRIFSQKKRKRGGIALLIDASGSMPLSTDDIDNILNKVPASIIACYSGDHASGKLRVLAKDGRRVKADLVGSGAGGYNVVDLPALQWLSRQPNTGKYWLSDGGVTGVGDACEVGNWKAVDELLVANDIYQVASVERLLKVIFEGEALQPRTTLKWKGAFI